MIRLAISLIALALLAGACGGDDDADTPFDPEKGPGYIRSTIENLESLDLSDEDRAKIYEGNARRVLGVR